MMYATADKATLNGKIRSVNKTANRAADQLQDDAEDAVSTIFEAANAIKEDVESLADNAGRRVRAVLDTAQSNALEVRDNVSMAISEKPLQSSLIALGVGVVLGFLFRRS